LYDGSCHISNLVNFINYFTQTLQFLSGALPVLEKREMGENNMNKRIVLAARPAGMVKDSDFALETVALPKPGAGELCIQNHYISLDPAMRGWMNAGTTYIKGVEIGEVMRAFTAGRVIESQHPDFKPGDWVQGMLGVQSYATSDGKGLTKINTDSFSPAWYLGILGMPGLTAYFGLLDKGQPKAGETILISGAAGMIGSLAGQIGKLKGCTVIGIAGGKEKCEYVKNELGFDAVIDYKTEDVATAIKTYAPKGIDIYFDNVGGEILDTALLNLARGARVVICGAISQYNDTQFNGLKNYMKIVSARGILTGIIVLDYFPRAAEAIADIGHWLSTGQIKYREHIVNGIEQFPEALRMLFTGENYGKLLIKL
jgi:NADPH-dependent curcumin reductase